MYEREKNKKKLFTPLFDTGSTLLNLALSDNAFYGFCPGTINTMPGGSSSGKTILALTMCLKAIKNKLTKAYKVYYDDAERTLAFDFDKLFPGLSSNLKAANGKEWNSKNKKNSNTIQEFKYNIQKAINENGKIIYVLDSLDSLTSEDEVEKELKKLIASTKDPDAIVKLSGTMGMEKAKELHKIFRLINEDIEQSNSLLLILQQTKQKIGAMPFEKKTYATGGEAPFFWSFSRIWLNKSSPIYFESYKNKNKLKIGNEIWAEVEKNKLTGKLRKVNFSVYPSYGIDDTSSCLNYLIETGVIKSNKNVFTSDHDFLNGKRKRVTKDIDSNKELIKQLNFIVEKRWNEIENEAELGRTKLF